MKLLTVGDSFTYGDELSDRSLAWPTLVADELGYELTNLALPSGGNTQVVRRVVENYQHADLVIIAWSHFARMEFADNLGVYDTWPGHSGIMFTGELSYRTELFKYLNRYYSDAYLYNQYLINIILLQNLLKQNNKRYLMLDAFGNNKEYQKLATGLVDQIDTSYYLGWPTETMMEWTNGCPRGPYGHFLEQGHQIVADKINEHIRNLGWVS